MEEIDLSYNRIEFINQTTFYFCEYLKKINLINNRLKSFNVHLTTSVISDLKLSQNHIEHVDTVKILNNFKSS